jgi:hypothetical protein
MLGYVGMPMPFIWRAPIPTRPSPSSLQRTEERPAHPSPGQLVAGVDEALPGGMGWSTTTFSRR